MSIDYSQLFSKTASIGRAQGGSGAAPPAGDLISLAYGLPDPLSFPSAELQAAAERVLREQSATALQYGPVQGHPGLRAAIAERLNEQEGLALGAERIAITNGSSQAIALMAELFLDPGDVMLLEGPTFLGAVRAFRLRQPRFEELPLDDAGLVPDDLEARLEQLAREGKRAKLLYTMPTFHNPAGVTMPLDRRLRVLAIAREHGLLIIEDDPYGDLRFEGSPLPSLLALDRDGLVVRLGSFSKILAAGVRLGWVAGPAPIIEALPGLKTDGGTNPFVSHLAAEWAVSGCLEPHVQRLRAVYRERRDALLRGLERHCAPYCRWTRPQGGFFIWVELDERIDPARLREAARAHGVDYLPGQACFASGRGERFLRLSFSYLPPERLEQAAERLGLAMADSLRVRAS